MKIKIEFNESITWLKGCFVIHFNYTGDGPLRNPIEVETISELDGRLRFQIKNQAGEGRVDLDQVDRIEVLKYENVEMK